MPNTNETHYIDDANWDLLADGTAADAADVKQPLLDLDGVLYDVATGATSITPDIDGGAIDDTSIGTTTPAVGKFTDLDVGTTTSGGVHMNLIADSGYPAYGMKLFRSNVVNPQSQIRHRGSGNFLLWAEDSGSAVVIRTNTGSQVVVNDTTTRAYGDLAVTGTLTKGAGNFLIDHPLDPENKDLYHGFVESPRYDLIYRGTAQLENGTATVSLDAAASMTPGTFAALTQNPQVWVQNDDGWDAVRGSVTEDTLTVECQNPDSSDTVAWLVVAERADAYIRSTDLTDEQGQLIPEHDKPVFDMSGVETEREPDSETDVQETITEALGTKGYPRHMEALGIQKELPKRWVPNTKRQNKF